MVEVERQQCFDLPNGISGGQLFHSIPPIFEISERHCLEISQLWKGGVDGALTRLFPQLTDFAWIIVETASGREEKS